jgi:hypothetical protein
MQPIFIQGDLFEGFNFQKTKNDTLTEINRKDKFSKGLIRNLDENGTFRYTPRHEIPLLKPYNAEIPIRLVPYCNIAKEPDYVCPHFYIDDSRTSGIYNNIEHFTQKIRRFKYVIAPDRSMYCGAPLALNLHTLFVNRAVAAYWQEHNIKVIPSFNGGDANSFDYCLEGLPIHSVLATGNVGVLKNKETTYLWKCLVEKAIIELEPTALLIYGNKIEFKNEANLPIYWYKDYIHTNLRH